MAKKIPKLFKPEYPKKIFDKKITKKIFLPEERAFIEKIYKLNDQGTYVLDPSWVTDPDKIPKDDFKHLQKLEKEIKKNSGIIDPIKLGLVGIILGGAALFFIVFFDAIVRDLVIRGMEGIFGAKVEVSGMNFKPWEGVVHFEGLKIANKDKPMENLIEFSQAQVSVDMGGAFQGKAVIKHLTAREMRFGTARATSGALPQADEPQKPTGNQELPAFNLPAPDLPFLKNIDLKNFDPGKVLSQVSKEFKTTGVVNEAQKTIDEKSKTWKSKIETGTKDMTTLNNQAQTLLKKDLKSFKSPAEALEFANQVGQTLDKANSLKEQIQSASNEIAKDGALVQSIAKDITKSLNDDWNKVSSMIALPTGGPVSMVSSLLMPYLGQNFGAQLGLVNKALQISAALKGDEKKKPVKITPKRLGQDLPFPVVTYPAFHLQDLEVSMGSRESKDLYEFTLKDATSDPDHVGKPLVLKYQRLDKDLSWEASLTLDFRKSTNERIGGAWKLMGSPVSFTEGMESVGAKSLTAISNWEASLTVSPDLSWSLDAGVNLGDTKLTWIEEGEIQQLISNILKTANPLWIKINLKVAGGATDFKATTNLDKAVEKEVSAYLEKKFKDLQVALKKEFDRWSKEQLKDYEGLLKNWSGIISDSSENLTDLNALQKNLDKKKSEAEQYAKDFVKNQAGNMGISLPGGLPKF